MTNQLMVTVELDNREGGFTLWTFKTNEEGYAEIILGGRVMDTLYDMGKFDSLEALENTVEYLIVCWKVKSQNLIAKTL